MAAVQDPPVDLIVSQPRAEKTYAARRENLRLVKEAEYHVLGPQGQKTGQTTGGVTIEFTGGQLRLPLEGKVTTAQGRKVDAAEIIAWLDQHHLNGDRHEGFFEIAQAAPPVSEDEFAKILGLAMNYDAAGLQAVIDAETAGWGRREIVASAEKALVQVNEFMAQVEAQQAAEAAKPKPAAKAK